MPNITELDITEFFKNACPKDYSASAHELGDNAGAITWQHAIEDSEDYLLLDSEEKREAFREFIKGAGAWSDEEIAAWTDTELNALCIQWVAGDIREAGIDTNNTDWQEYEAGCQEGIYSSSLFQGTDGRIYFDIGS